MDLQKPDDWIQQDAAWDKLCDGLFAWLQQAIARNGPLDFAPLENDLKTWEGAFSEQKQRNQWNAARRLLWCAARATESLDSEPDAISRMIPIVTEGIPEFIRGHEGWAQDCIRLFRGGSGVVHSRRVPVALVDELAFGGGVFTLVLEVLRPGGGQIFLHPEDTLRTYADDDFTGAMQTAWEAAKAFVRQEGGDIAFDGRWRLLRQGDQPLPEVRGSSAGGAAALGWYRALTGTLYDERVIVLAEIDSQPRLGPVGGVEAKVQVIAQDDRFDTIVVADEANQREAEATLRKLNKSGVIRVVNLK